MGDVFKGLIFFVAKPCFLKGKALFYFKGFVYLATTDNFYYVMENEDIILGQIETYKASSKIWSFKRVDDIVHGINLKLSNMVGSFPFEYAGMVWKDSERLYLCGEFSLNTEKHRQIQDSILAAKSGYAAKRFYMTPNKELVRSDFNSFKLQWMLHCVWEKCKGNGDFRNLLFSIPSDVILVENTTTDNGGSAEFWGCRNRELVRKRKALEKQLREQYQGMPKREIEFLINVETNKIDDIGEWYGQNNIGKIIMICKRCLEDGTMPDIDYGILSLSNIYIAGNLLRF